MADITNLSSFLGDVADAIRSKKGSEESIPAKDFDTEILSIETGIDTSDADATEENIEKGKTAYVNGLKVTGTLADAGESEDVMVLADNISVGNQRGYDCVSTKYINSGKKIHKDGWYVSQHMKFEDLAPALGVTPEKIVEGNTILNVEGTYKGSGGGAIKQFSTIEEMNNSTGNKEGDLAVVYSLNMRNIQQGETITNTLLFPDTVTFDATVNIEFGINGDLSIDNDALEFTLTSDKCYISSVGSEFCRIVYDSTDGKIYTKTSSTVSGISVTNLTVPELDEHLYSFVQIAIASFKGIYKYNGTSWELAPTDLATVADDVYLTKFYGKNGVETGTLTTSVSNSFADTNAAIYKKVQQAYDNMTPRVLTDSDKTIDKNIYFIPVKKDGTVLLDTSSVTNMTSMFSGCTNLQTIPLLDTSSVTSMDSMLFGCTNLTTIPLLNTSNVTNMNSMFYNCSNLTTIPQLDTSSATNMQYIFHKCSNLTEIPLLNTSNVTSMSKMFTNCSSLSDESLNNILAMCTNATSYTSTKTLKYIGLTSDQTTKCTTLSNYSAFTAAGWTTGY